MKILGLAPEINYKKSYTYRDIGIVPTRVSTIESRDHVDTRSSYEQLGLEDIGLPLLAAPMTKVVGPELAEVLFNHGVPVVLPRSSFFPDDMKTWRQLCNRTNNMCRETVFCSIPAVNAREWIHSYLSQPTPPNKFCIDLANGFSTVLKKALDSVQDLIKSNKIITGNIASVEGYLYLAELGVHGVRVGIGGGSVCTTSLATGIGVGQASLVREISYLRDSGYYEELEQLPLIIADGGIKCPGDMVKAIALGADLVMAGGIFAGTEEAPGEIVSFNGHQYKMFAGQASMTVKASKRYVEGAEKLVKYKGPVEDVLTEYTEGLKSAMSYLDCRTIAELRSHLPEEAFVILSDAAQYERTPHAT